MGARTNHSFVASPELVWERLMAQTRYGRYADKVESRITRYALGVCPNPGALLDVGCEGGRWSQVFAVRGWEVTATDVDAESLQICQARIPHARCILSDPSSRRLPAGDESIDVALCIEVGPVIHSDWAVPEFARLLKQGGRLVGVCWNRHSWRGVLYHKVSALRRPGSSPSLGYPIPYKTFRRQMIEHGFRFERELGYAWGPFRRTSNSSFVNIWAAFERFSGLEHIVPGAPMVAFVAQKMPDSGSSDRL